jgi:hypothetical protein
MNYFYDENNPFNMEMPSLESYFNDDVAEESDEE